MPGSPASRSWRVRSPLERIRNLSRLARSLSHLGMRAHFDEPRRGVERPHSLLPPRPVVGRNLLSAPISDIGRCSRDRLRRVRRTRPLAAADRMAGLRRRSPSPPIASVERPLAVRFARNRWARSLRPCWCWRRGLAILGRSAASHVSPAAIPPRSPRSSNFRRMASTRSSIAREPATTTASSRR